MSDFSNFIAINPNFVSGVQTYGKIVVNIDGIGAYCVICNYEKGNLQRQAYIGKIDSRVYRGQKYESCIVYDADKVIANPHIIDAALLPEHQRKALRSCAVNLQNAMTNFLKKNFAETKVIIDDEKIDFMEAINEAVTSAFKTDGIAPAGIAGNESNANVEITKVVVEMPVRNRTTATMAKMVNAEYLYGFTNGNYYEIINDDGEYITIKNDFGLDSKVNKSRCQTLRVFVEEPLEKEYENQ